MAEKLKTCFVVCPIGDDGSDVREHSDTVFECYIEPALTEVGGFDKPVRADHISTPGSITQQVFDQIAEADLVIADLSGPNANVFYELGVRHTLKKRFVQMVLKGQKLPFDVNQLRTIEFDTANLRGAKKVVAALGAAIKETYKPSFQVTTPLGYSVTLETLEKGDAEAQSLKLILEKLDQIYARIPAPLSPELQALARLRIAVMRPDQTQIAEDNVRRLLANPNELSLTELNKVVVSLNKALGPEQTNQFLGLAMSALAKKAGETNSAKVGQGLAKVAPSLGKPKKP